MESKAQLSRGITFLVATFMIPGAVSLAQPSIQTEGAIETAGQLISTVPTGTPPLVVTSTTRVDNLNADSVDGFDGVALDGRLVAAEVMLVELEGVIGRLSTANIPKTGQTTCWDADGNVISCAGTGQDGDYQSGLAWPTPRLTDNGDGTVTDNLTGLLWLADAGCFDSESWDDALALASGLFDGATIDPGGGDCDLSDGSEKGAWRLPNVREMQSLAHFEFVDPSVPDNAGTGKCDGLTPCAFSGINNGEFWSSTTSLAILTFALRVQAQDGRIFAGAKTNLERIWPVRGAR